MVDVRNISEIRDVSVVVVAVVVKLWRLLLLHLGQHLVVNRGLVSCRLTLVVVVWFTFSDKKYLISRIEEEVAGPVSATSWRVNFF